MHYDATFKGDSLLSLLILNTLNMSTNRQSKHQQIVKTIYSCSKDDVITIQNIKPKQMWNIPKIITSDINFQLIFGFQPPMDSYNPKLPNQSYALNGKNHKNSYGIG